MKTHRDYMRSEKVSAVIKVIGFWGCFWVLLVGLRHVHLPAIGSAGAPVSGGIIAVVMLLAIAGLLRMEGASTREIGLVATPSTLPHFALGLGLGVAVVAAMFVALLLLTPLEIRAAADSNILSILGASFLILLILALMEEIVFRSYPLFMLRQAFGIRPAVYVTSVAFAFYHGLAFENLLGPGVWGLFFAYMAISTKSIALPTGFHVGLNWVQAMLGMKPQYSGSIWELSIADGPGFMDVEALGLTIQVTMLAIGIAMIELLARKQRGNSSQ